MIQVSLVGFRSDLHRIRIAVEEALDVAEQHRFHAPEDRVVHQSLDNARLVAVATGVNQACAPSARHEQRAEQQVRLGVHHHKMQSFGLRLSA